MSKNDPLPNVRRLLDQAQEQRREREARRQAAEAERKAALSQFAARERCHDCRRRLEQAWSAMTKEWQRETDSQGKAPLDVDKHAHAIAGAICSLGAAVRDAGLTPAFEALGHDAITQAYLPFYTNLGFRADTIKTGFAIAREILCRMLIPGEEGSVTALARTVLDGRVPWVWEAAVEFVEVALDVNRPSGPSAVGGSVSDPEPNAVVEQQGPGQVSPPEGDEDADGPGKEHIAIALLLSHPDWSNKQIAEKVGCNPKSMTPKRWKRFKALRDHLRTGNAPPRGSKGGGGEVESWEDER